ncbi:succinate-semialdehyde dehydrogenase/glutarate-semialdehyde dehydrogenase [Phycicoccus badiiscoriae]|uniref:Succinate-semialdehyde dehydrogenase/glutarate-semialdehyde dehydrogenase n=1 Tax=Pedococcus badiiscoriae TaxID=642776 RepID=A0A852WKY6_9MICO|nr:NAD-dependent succinate-semialdehyde dehydrogenase [Pedococcus badiiscoriae]NYG06146.1 succinate-semialdehyde dehydrogenase/glutarate-semialdehyde dehydrogenase [Pedococcus badiiscoriae]
MPVDPAEAALVASVPTGLFIDGQWRESSDGARVDVEDPATGLVLASVADATVADGDAALSAAAAAQADWARTAPRERSELLRAAYELLVERTEDFATLMTLEMGKPLAEARGEVAYGAEFFRWFAEEAVRISGRWMTAPNGATRLLTMKKPVGPTLMVTPWNFPLAMGTRKIGPAIAAGCTMVVKPATQTPLTMLALAELLREVGVPAGVVNVITTTRTAEVMEPLVRDARARKLTFTGSTPVGRTLVEQSATQLLRVSMELGGNAPFIVFEDADLDAAVEGALLAKMRNTGEACTAANRFLVHESVADTFAARLAERMAGMPVGRGTEDGVTVGPLIDAKAVAKVSSLVDDAVRKGARVACGGKEVGDRGYFYAPTVLTDVPADADLVREEIFGPVAAIGTFTTEEEAVARANDTDYGLAAYAFTRDLSRVLRLGEVLEYGMVGVNTGIVSNPAAPFGGMKASGFGREGGFEGIDEYLETTYLGIAP